DAGDGEALQVCCGAFNMQVGDLVPLATVGAKMPGGMEIARRKLRGEWSNGMLCSSRELELGDDHGGILVLPADLDVGAGFAEAMGVEADALLDLAVTPNRPDALSVIGVARDAAAALGVPFVLPDLDPPTSGTEASELTGVEVLDPDLCGRFTARVLSGITIGSSAPLIARRLALSGMRPINSIVDISNYVMLEYGQPSHTFDLARVAGAGLRVRRGRDGETIETLDGATRMLASGDGVIADGDDVAIGIAGVMGGASTEISESTADVLLELAWWDPVSITRTSKRLGLRSEASNRFEKGVDPDVASPAARRFAQLAIDAGATLHPGELVIEGNLPDRSPILVRTERVNAVLGTELERDEMASLLAPIGFDATVEGDDLRVALPTWRPDATAEIDIVEEIARRHGYDRLGRTLPTSPHRGALTPRQVARRQIRSVLIGLGCDEVSPTPFLAPGELDRWGLRSDVVVVANPLVTEESVLRTSLLPGLVATLAYNATHRATGLSVFEVGHCYAAPPAAGDMPLEWTELAVALGGQEAPRSVQVVASIFEALGLGVPEITPAEVAGLHPTRAATVAVVASGSSTGGSSIEVGEVGEVDPIVAAEAGVSERVAWVRLDLDRLLAIPTSLPQARAVSRYPTADIDLAFAVPDDVAAHRVEAVLRGADVLVADVTLFDVFRGAQVGDGRRSLAYGIRLQAPDRTLTDADVAEVRAGLIAAVESAFDATLRA
ncbi:MAG TPA: phenylalanine--tRNA ligase subunit beta, partial [Microthrixaceae bacterium]|nr:phenylalanine--tRNA ligase subunit beta [Microthrixaceae bacterium]